MEQPHFLLIPYSEQGHFNPMLSLASQLAALGCKVTFVKAERRAAAVLPLPKDTGDANSKSNSQETEDPAAEQKWKDSSGVAQAHDETSALLANLQFVTLAAPKKGAVLGSADSSAIPRFQILQSQLAGLEERQNLVAKIVEDSKASAHPISCVICDWLLWRWVRHIVRAYGLRSAVFSIFSALTFFTSYLGFSGKVAERDDLLVSEFGMPSQKDAPSSYYGLKTMKDTPELALQKREFGRRFFEGIEDAGTILVNSFKALEAPLVPSLEAWDVDVRFIGPCLPAWNENDIGLGNKLAQQAGSIFAEEGACLSWLDLQEDRSVLFVSFGSEGTVEAKQVEEIAMGIDQSGYKFLWVFRSDAPASSGPTHFFREQSGKNKKGMFVSWAPQRKVLQHPSIGGFLTHSGWNSTLEAVTFGVPMLCLPLLGDQPLNASFVQDYLQVGTRFSIREDGLVHREEVSRGVQAAMQGQFLDRVSRFHEYAQLAFKEAHHTLASFVKTSST